MSKQKKIITVSGYFNCDMDVVVDKEDKEDDEITRRAELIVESHMKTIGVRGYGEFSTPAQDKRRAENSVKWEAERKRDESKKIKKRIAKAVTRELAKKGGG